MTKTEISPNIITSYFTDIFNSAKTCENPTIDGIEVDVTSYYNILPATDAQIGMDNLKFALIKLGKGVSFDGISAHLLSLLPENLQEGILTLFQFIFNTFYPSEWRKQLLIPIAKKGHSLNYPKLRGVAIGPLLSRLYDIKIDKKFFSWFVPNPEQAGFRKYQGCVLQIFAFLLLFDMSNHLGKNIFIGLLDYEKAFDFVNRSTLLNKLMAKGVLHDFLKSLANIYQSTSYLPKISYNMLGGEITTFHGVTQGRTSSCNLFSFYVADMPECLFESSAVSFTLGCRKMNTHHFL